MVIVSQNDPEPAPQLPCSPRSFAKAHLDRLRSESQALHAEVDDLSQDFHSQSDEPESLKALRTQSAVLNAEVHNLEQVLQNATGDDLKQEIWEAVQRALRKRHLAELISLRAAASLSGRHRTPKKIDRHASSKRESSRSSHKSSDNTSSTETPALSGTHSDASDSTRSDKSESVEKKHISETVAPPKPMTVPAPKWVPPPTAVHMLNDQNVHQRLAHSDLQCFDMPSPICPDLRRPPKLSLPVEVIRAEIQPQQLDASAESGHNTHLAGETLFDPNAKDVTEASCLSMSLEDWYDPEFRQIHNRPSLEKVQKMGTNEFGEGHIMTAMEEDVQTALEVLGFRRAKDDEEECNSLLSIFWPLW